MGDSSGPERTSPQDRTLHFYPSSHTLLWIVGGKTKLKAEGWGGEEPEGGVAYRVMPPRQTTPGNYVIYSHGPYRTKTWNASRIPWGTRLMVDQATFTVFFETGNSSPKWQKVTDRIPDWTWLVIRQEYYRMYGESHLYDSDYDSVPSIWVFNDFGPTAIRYFVDRNQNRRLDEGESLSGEMFHTTPDDEANVALHQTVRLQPSHGCIHVNPIGRDKLFAAGAFKKGTPFIVHPYSEKAPNPAP
jgi:hypothetical protein